MRRRWAADAAGTFRWRALFCGRGVDIGAGDDPVPLPECQPFDREHGDANHILNTLSPASFDWLHSSQCLEHVNDPQAVFRQWVQLVKPGGHIIITVPSWELYEGMRWPSRWNPEHKSTWSLWQKGSPARWHVHVPTWLDSLRAEGRVLRCALVDTNYDYTVAGVIDQTFDPVAAVEAFIEVVIQGQ